MHFLNVSDNFAKFHSNSLEIVVEGSDYTYCHPVLCIMTFKFLRLKKNIHLLSK